MFREVLEGKIYGIPADVYSLGGVLSFIIRGTDPSCPMPFDNVTGFPIFPDRPPNHYSLVALMMNKDATKRAELANIHSFDLQNQSVYYNTIKFSFD